jgi:cytochrome c nitrite reductase small subunit
MHRLLRFLRARSAGLVLCAFLGVPLGLGAYTFWYAEGASYFSNDPKSCVNCHAMREHYDSWHASSHHAIAACNDCHVPHELAPKLISKAENGFWHSTHFTLQNYPDPIHIRPHNARVLQQNCITCHQDAVGHLLQNGALGDETNQCVRCHAGVGHGAAR